MRARSSRDGLAVPISNSRYTATESQLTISPLSCSASASERAVFPLAVGPRITTSKGSPWFFILTWRLRFADLQHSQERLLRNVYAANALKTLLALFLLFE